MKRKDRALERKAVARFIDGRFRVLLLEGVEASVSKYERTEEGYNYKYDCWVIHAGRIYAMTSEDGRDCDGRHESTVHYAADYSTRSRKTGRLAWERSRQSQRAYAAEAAGY